MSKIDFSLLPDSAKTEVTCLEAVRANGIFLKYVPVVWRTPELCAIAVEQNSFALRYTPANRVTAALAVSAVAREPYSFRDLPPHFRQDLTFMAELLKLVPNLSAYFTRLERQTYGCEPTL